MNEVDLNKADRICVFVRDPENHTYAVTSISRESIIDVGYNSVTNELAITLKGMTFQGETKVEQVQKSRVYQGQIEYIKNAYEVHDMYRMQGFNHSVIINNEKEIRKVWKMAGT